MTIVLQFDGASKGNPGIGGSGAILLKNGIVMHTAMYSHPNRVTNNVAEYRGLIIGLKMAIEKGYIDLYVEGDSKLVIEQVFGTWKEACEEAGVAYIASVRDLYEIRWTNEELINQIAEFISTTESRSAESFDAWCRLDSSRASLGTVRNQIGSWSDSYELALINLRKLWTSHQP